MMLIMKADMKNLMSRNGRFKTIIELLILVTWVKLKIQEYQRSN